MCFVFAARLGSSSWRLFWLVAWSTTRALVGCEPTSENHPSVTPRFVALVLLISKLRLSALSASHATSTLTKTTLGFGLSTGWAAPRSKAPSALILKLLSAYQRTSHNHTHTT